MSRATVNRDEEIEWAAPRSRQPKKVTTTVAQTRINRIWDPPHTFFRSWLTWLNRLMADAAAWPSLDLKEYAEEELGPNLARQKALLHSLPETWTGEDYLREHDRLLRMEGKMAAILETLQRREKQARLDSPHGSAISSRGRATVTPAAPTWDPFENC